MPGAVVYVPGSVGQTGQESAGSSGQGVRITAPRGPRGSAPVEQGLSGFAGRDQGLPLAGFEGLESCGRDPANEGRRASDPAIPDGIEFEELRDRAERRLGVRDQVLEADLAEVFFNPKFYLMNKS